MNKEYFIEKIEELKITNKNKLNNIEEILSKCNFHEEEIYKKINYLSEENEKLLSLLKNSGDIFDMIITDLI